MNLLERRRMLMGKGGIPKPQNERYLTFDILVAGTLHFGMQKNLQTSDYEYLEYSKNGGDWVRLTNVDSTIVNRDVSAAVGDKFRFRGKGITCGISSAHVNFIQNTAGIRYKASGNMASLLYVDDFADKAHENKFIYLFAQSKVTDVTDLYFDMNAKYQSLFESAVALTNVPDLLYDRDIENWGLSNMFYKSGIPKIKMIITGSINGYALSNTFNKCPNLNDVTLYIGGTSLPANSMTALQGLTQTTGIARLGGVAWTNRSYFNLPSDWTVVECDINGDIIT